MSRQAQLNRQLRNIEEGDLDAYHQYLRTLLRGSVQPQWRSLFKYWMLEPCRSCNGTGRADSPWQKPRGQLFKVLSCMSCNGKGTTCLRDAVVLHLEFPSRFPNVDTHTSVAINQAAHLAWSYIAFSDHNDRVHASISTTLALDDMNPIERLAYSIRRYCHIRNSPRNRPSRKIYHASAFALIKGVNHAIHIKLIDRAHVKLLDSDWAEQHEARWLIPNNDQQPTIKTLESLRKSVTVPWKPWLRRNHWLLGHIYQRGRLKSVKRASGLWPHLSKGFRYLPGK